MERLINGCRFPFESNQEPNIGSAPARITSDAKWYENTAGKDINRQPVAIYECHIGSWMKHQDGTEDKGIHRMAKTEQSLF